MINSRLYTNIVSGVFVCVCGCVWVCVWCVWVCPTPFITDHTVCIFLYCAGEGTPFFLYMAFQHMHHPQYAGEKFTNSSIRGPYGDALVSSDNYQHFQLLLM